MAHYTSPRIERIKRRKRAERLATFTRRALTAVAIIFLVLAIGYVGEQDRQYELLNAGYTLEEIRK